MAGMLSMLNPVALESAVDFAAALIEACKTVRPEVDPLSAITDTDAYPRLARVPQVEFMVGWISATACVLGRPVHVLWAELGPRAEQQYARTAVHAKERKLPQRRKRG